jgi:fatty acid desaturase
VVAKKLIERQRRGIFGKIMLTVFWLANGFMALWFWGAVDGWSKMATPASEAGKAGQGIGIAMGLGVILSIWACVEIVTGLFALMTRGHKEIMEVDI